MLGCYCAEPVGTDWYYFEPDDFSVFENDRGKSCKSCQKKIAKGEICLRFPRGRATKSFSVEEIIYGDAKRLADYYVCEKCGEIWFNLTELGYCLRLGDNFKEALVEYWEKTGFKK